MKLKQKLALLLWEAEPRCGDLREEMAQMGILTGSLLNGVPVINTTSASQLEITCFRDKR